MAVRHVSEFWVRVGYVMRFSKIFVRLKQEKLWPNSRMKVSTKVYRK